jgi:hypothetical protein
MDIWSRMEQRFLVHPYQVKPFKFKIRATAAVVIIVGFILYGTFILSTVYRFIKSAEMQNHTIESTWDHYVVTARPHIFVHVPYSFVLGLFVEVSGLPLIFVWFYMELFVIMVCIGLVARFQQINERLDGIRGKVSRCQCSNLSLVIGFLHRLSVRWFGHRFAKTTWRFAKSSRKSITFCAFWLFCQTSTICTSSVKVYSKVSDLHPMLWTTFKFGWFFCMCLGRFQVAMNEIH